MTADTDTLDGLDRKVVRALQLAPRAPFSRLGAVLDVSEQTAARRYRRMRRAGLLKVTAVIDPVALGQNSWAIRVQCRPSGAASLAQALAQRDDIGWVSIGAGGTEVVCVVRSHTAQAREDLLLQRLPRTTQVLGLSAYLSLRHFVAAGPDDWTGLAHELTAEQEAALLTTDADGRDEPSGDPDGRDEPPVDADGRDEPSPHPAAAEPGGLPVALRAADLAMIDVLVADGRASWPTVAAAGRISERRAERRIRELQALGVHHLDVDIVSTALGLTSGATLWLSVTPAELDRAGRALRQLPEVTFAAAISGPSNLMISTACRDVAQLYRFVTERIAAIPGIAAIEIAPTMRVVKQAGTLMVDGRLAVT